MTYYYKHVDIFDLRKYDGYDNVIYIGANKNSSDHIFGITENGIIFTLSDIANTFKILSEPDEI